MAMNIIVGESGSSRVVGAGPVLWSKTIHCTLVSSKYNEVNNSRTFYLSELSRELDMLLY